MQQQSQIAFQHFLQQFDPRLTSLKQLREEHLEISFQTSFRPDHDQIDYLRQKQKLATLKYQYSKWRDSINFGQQESFESKKLALIKTPQSSEDEQDGSVAQDDEEESKQDVRPTSTKFRREVSKPYTVRCKEVGRVGPFYTELDKLSQHGEAKLLTDPLTCSQYRSQQSKSEGLLLDIEA